VICTVGQSCDITAMICTAPAPVTPVPCTDLVATPFDCTCGTATCITGQTCDITANTCS
jgi:hypothetical protein